MLQLAVSLAICGISIGVQPFIVDFWLLIIIITIGGVIVGFNDAIIQQILLRVWGEEDSASILQLHHFTYSIGAFLARDWLSFAENSFFLEFSEIGKIPFQAPLLVSPFYGSDEDADELCGNKDPDDDNRCEGCQVFYCIE